MDWRPLSKRNDPEAAKAYDVLHEGVPDWMTVPIGQWVYDTLLSFQTRSDYMAVVQSAFQILRLKMPSTHPGTCIEHLASRASEGRVPEAAIDTIDAVLWFTMMLPTGHKNREDLERILYLGGSVWTIGKNEADQPCLHRRVDETVTAAAKAEMEEKGNAAIHLHRAWHRVYSRNADASGAYREAVRAVEAAAKPVVAPKAVETTLGKMIAAMRDKPEKWTAVLDGNGRGSGMDHLIGMCQSIWTSQLDRHGTDDESVRLDVSPEEAEAAVHLAVTLVHWFRTGAIRPAP